MQDASRTSGSAFFKAFSSTSGQNKTIPCGLRTTIWPAGKNQAGPATLQPYVAGIKVKCSQCTEHPPSRTHFVLTYSRFITLQHGRWRFPSGSWWSSWKIQPSALLWYPTDYTKQSCLHWRYQDSSHCRHRPLNSQENGAATHSS